MKLADISNHQYNGPQSYLWPFFLMVSTLPITSQQLTFNIETQANIALDVLKSVFLANVRCSDTFIHNMTHEKG